VCGQILPAIQYTKYRAYFIPQNGEKFFQGRLFNAEVILGLPGIKKALLAPSCAAVELPQNGDDVTIRIPEFSCHQMIELQS
jgi:multidrug efflux pump subunit AcrA (membrane-fusion protein)